MSASPPKNIEKGTSLWKDAWLRLRRNKVALGSGVFLVIMVGLCFGLAWFTGHDPNQQSLTNKFAAPGGGHLLGTDQMGRDLFSRILFGGQISLLVGFVATAVAFVIGILYGAISGYVGGRLDALMMRIVDILYAIPFLVLVILLQEVLSSSAGDASEWLVKNWNFPEETTYRFANILPLFIAIGALGWLTLARITRSQVLSLKQQEFAQAAVSLGLKPMRILIRHIIPNTLGPAIVYVTLTIPSFIMYEATLSFLGLGIKAPNSSWGVLIKDGANYMETQPMLLILPGLFFTSTLFALNFLGDGLRDALDPQAAKD
ncbi:MAG: ABC transporter permease [Akkermansiaceae bacterium]|nr:ABC transporter permease [Akkermansiaceae bacterium]